MTIEYTSIGNIQYYAERVKILTKEFFNCLKTKYSFQESQIVVNWEDNSRYLFSSKNRKAILIELEKLKTEFDLKKSNCEIETNCSFSDYILTKWVKAKEKSRKIRNFC